MRFIDLDELENDRNFWYAAVGFMYVSGILQIVLEEFLMGIATIGMAIVFTSVAHQKMNEE